MHDLLPKRDIIFISHATPEDNDFTLWLASRLQADGFEVWIDKHALIGGEKFWQEIDLTIRNKAIKVLLVYSQNICFQKQPGNLKEGVEKEKSLAESIAKMNGLKDFIILLNIDGSAYNLFIGADMLNQIPFYENWAVGYSQLLKKFNKENITPKNAPVGDFAKWYEDEYILNSGVKAMHELYYDSWWPIKKLPSSFYMYVFANDAIATHIQQQLPYPAGRITNVITTFYNAESFEVVVDGESGVINYREKHEIKVDDVVAGIGGESFPSARDTQNHFRHLLQRIFHMVMRERQLSWFKMANNKLAYFFLPKVLGKPVKFQYTLRSKKQDKRKALYGQYLSNCWHFALSSKPVLSPQIAFSFKSHIIFTEDGQRPLSDKDKMHSARRKKGRMLFNEDWRDMLFAFLHALCQDGKTVDIQLSPKFELSLNPWTNRYHSKFGYVEPKEQNRHDILVIEDEYSDEDDDDNETYKVDNA